MINDIEKIFNNVKNSFPDLKIKIDKYGKLYSIALFSEIESYQVDITKSEIGLTYRVPSEVDFSGCDISFDDINSAIDFLINYRLQNERR